MVDRICFGCYTIKIQKRVALSIEQLISRVFLNQSGTSVRVFYAIQQNKTQTRFYLENNWSRLSISRQTTYVFILC